MKYLGKLFISGSLVFASLTVSSQNIKLADESVYSLPESVMGIKQPVMSLDGSWKFQMSSGSKWMPIQVPGEPVMQGYGIKHDEPFRYKKIFTVPKDYEGNRIILRFDGVYSDAKLYVNNKFVRHHKGGFTRWETDVTSFIKPGAKNEIQLEVIDKLDDISYASGYAHHPIGGILRDVTLFALPNNSMFDFFVETALDSLYQDAQVNIGYNMVKDGGEIKLKLQTPDGKTYPLAQNSFKAVAGPNLNSLSIENPLKWTAEQPNLYTLTVSVEENGKETNRFEKKIGFRDIKVKGNQMLVNGEPVKLRGACRHDIHPTLGRTTTRELDSLDVVLFKKSNMNYVRTSHYPPTERFLEFCNENGIYVECETAVCFVDTHRQKNYSPGATQNNSDYTDQYLSQCREMVKSFRSHPSVLFWSIGNESQYGINFQKSWDYVKATDKTRPVIFSYPGSMGDKKPIFDLLSMHYQDVNGDLNQWGITTRNFQGMNLPTVFDEWAHPACYTYSTLQTDPNIREFWGESLEKMWSGLFEAKGGLGGAIWGYIDETFMVPQLKTGTPFWKEFARTAKPEDFQGDCVGYGEWGIVDVWRREKPEFWATKKAYSPIRLLQLSVPSVINGERINLPIYNRFDHTNLKDVEIRYTYKGKESKVASPDIEPHKKGALCIPSDNWEEGESLMIGFYTKEGDLIDMEKISLGNKFAKEATSMKTIYTPLVIKETSDSLIINGKDFSVPFSKNDGLIHNLTVKDEVIMEKGPFVNLDINLNHLTGAEVRKSANKFLLNADDWKMKGISYNKVDKNVIISLSGEYKDVEADIKITVTPEGLLRFNYSVAGNPNGYIRETGLAFRMARNIDSLSWDRKGLWSCYPEDAFAGNKGNISLYNGNQVAYRQNPDQPWGQDTHNYYYWADKGANCNNPLTNSAKGMKENIYSYALYNDRCGIEVLSSDASLGCRLNKKDNEELVLYVNNQWDYPEIAWGNYCKTLEAVPCQGVIELDLMKK